MLIYSSLTNFSYLTESDELSGKEQFEHWVKKWMLERYPLPCNEAEMFLSRCRLLNLPEVAVVEDTTRKPPREILYTWGKKGAGQVSDGRSRNVVYVKVEDLLEAYRNGMIDCIEQLETNEKLARIFKKKANKLFSSINYSA